jgi:hypothetical protein
MRKTHWEYKGIQILPSSDSRFSWACFPYKGVEGMEEFQYVCLQAGTKEQMITRIDAHKRLLERAKAQAIITRAEIDRVKEEANGKPLLRPRNILLDMEISKAQRAGQG